MTIIFNIANHEGFLTIPFLHKYEIKSLGDSVAKYIVNYGIFFTMDSNWVNQWGYTGDDSPL